ncbi:MAG: CHASE2 domain-containing protein [Rhodospirillales bacterium]|nr:CHASE2 domain-containing protein [Rhodospirillales bacterium]
MFAVLPAGRTLEGDVGLAWLFRLRGPVAPPPGVAVVAIDERSAIALGLRETPRDWPRSLHGRLVAALVDQGAEVIAFDMIFGRPQSEHEDASFARAIAAAGRVLLVEPMERRCERGGGAQAPPVCIDKVQRPISLFADAAWGLAPFPLPRIPDARVSAFWAFLGALDDLPTLPALAVHARVLRRGEAWQRLFHEASNGIIGRTTTIETETRFLRRTARAGLPLDPLLPGGEIGAISAPESAERAALREAIQFLYSGEDSRVLNFYGPPGTIRHIPYARLVVDADGDSSRQDLGLKGAAVFVGASELGKPSQGDYFRTVFPRADGVEMSGAEIAATAYANLLEGTTLRPLGPPPIFALLCALGALFCGCAYSLTPRAAAAATVALTLAYVAFASLLFDVAAIWLPLAVPLLIVLPSTVAVGGTGQLLRARHQRAAAEEERETAVEENLARSTFVATVSHEIRTLLNWVTGLVERLDNAGLDDIERGVVAQVRQFSNNLLQLLNDVLDMAKMEAGELRFAPETVAVRPLVRSVIDMLRPNAAAKGLELSLEVSSSVPQAVIADPLRLCQILWNLGGNAVKFTDRGSVNVRLDTEGGGSAEAMLVLSVADTGIGIPEAAQSTLFAPFHQADARTAHTYGGSGLGLSIVHRLADMMGGTIVLSSRPGEGSTFTVQLPLTLPPADEETGGVVPAFDGLADQPVPELVPELAPGRPVGGTSVGLPRPAAGEVLVAEDDPLNRMLIEGQLASLGLRACVCADGAEAWSSLQQRPAAVLITDRHMPTGLSGVDLARRVRAVERFAGVRIIGLTADARPEARRECLDAGMDLVLSKPLKPSDLPNAFLRLDISFGIAVEPPREPAVTHAPDGDAIFDAENLIRMFGSLEGQASQILSDFVKRAEEVVAETKRAADERDAARVRNEAHRMAGCSGSVGAIRFGRVFSAIEAAAITADWAHVDRIVGTLDSELAEVVHAIAGLDAEGNGQAAVSSRPSGSRRSLSSG